MSNIIDEMRREADNADYDGENYLAGCVRDWADRLAASGALVPVPVGDPCEYDKAWDDGENLVFIGADLFATNGDDGDLPVIGERRRNEADAEFPGSTIVQPIRLVPLAEWEGRQ